MAKGIIGREFTFTALFLDAVGTPISVTTPTIEVFHYDETGVKVSDITAGTVLPDSNPPETGRYAYSYSIPDTWDTRVQLYGLMQGIDPGSGDILYVEREVDLFTDEITGDGLSVSFVKDGEC